MAKLLVTRAGLTARRDRADLFTSYSPVTVDGDAAEHALAFDRGGVVLRHLPGLGGGLRRGGGVRRRGDGPAALEGLAGPVEPLGGVRVQGHERLALDHAVAGA